MKNWIGILSGLLVLQLALALGLNLAVDDYAAFEPSEPLLAFEPESVDALRIEDGEGTVDLVRREGAWVLPGLDDFPADQEAVTRLLERLAGLQKGWPVATTSGALERFEVAEDAYERRISLTAAGTPAPLLYLGTSPGLRKTHVRPEGEVAVYAASLDIWEAGAAPSDWIDKGILTLGEAAITRIELPGLTLERDGEALRVAGLGEGEQTDAAAARTLVNRLANLRIQSVVGEDVVPAGDTPALTITVTRAEGDPLTYRFWKQPEGTDYLLTRSDLDHRLVVAGFSVEPLVSAGRAALVRVPEAESAEAGPSADGGPPRQ
jgi:hypothetical protein